MRPLRLTISAWGPYPERCSIDFTRMNEAGIYLITGPTGAGKTTIFDAISYALYGQLSGQLREKNTVRSDFARADTPTFVELLMEHGGSRYEIRRNPEYKRPRKRKSASGEAFTIEKESASLKLPDGSVLAGNSEVNQKIRELLVLDYRQFKQLSMIAQGEFARFLTESAQEKTRIFREIFDTGLYERFARRLKEKANALEKEVETYRLRAEENIRTLRCEDSRWLELSGPAEGSGYPYERLLQCLGTLLKENKKQQKQASKEAAALKQALEEAKDSVQQAEQGNRVLEQLQQVQQKLQLLEAKQPAAREKEKRLKAAEAAESVRLKELAAVNAGQQAEKEEGRLRQLREEADHLRAEAGTLRQILALKEETQAAYELMIRWEKAEAEVKIQAEKLTEATAKLDRWQQAYCQAEAEEEKARERYETAQRLWRRSVIGIAAGLVEEGKPCPVCGSLEHPAVASLAQEVPDEKQLQELEGSLQASREELRQLHGKAAAAREVKEREQERYEACLAVSASLEKQKEGLAEPVSALLQKPYEQQLKQFLKKAERALEIDATLAEKKRQQAEQKKQAEQAGRDWQEAKKAFELVREQKGFGSEEAYRQAVLGPEEKETLQKELESYHGQLSETRGLEEHLKEEATRQSYTDVSPLKEQVSGLLKEQEISLKRQQELVIAAEGLAQTKEQLSRNYKNMQKEAQSYGTIKDLSNMANGENAKRLVFEQYVLAGYFEEILQAANIRLRQMSQGRYELSRTTENPDGRRKDNLDITVMDYYTGKCRPVKTLSGGESFKASLSLALGMSDVMQAEHGGIRVEALFLDEGFGSLDAQSLDAACSVLTGLRERDRVIGIISHVEELKERIPDQILVEKGRNGSSLHVGQ